jgi:Tfp pilus assembly protein PilN
MIEINLLPGAGKRSRQKVSLAMPGFLGKLGSKPAMDRWTIAMVAGWVIGPLVIAWLFFGTQGQMKDLDVRIQGAQRDSVRYATLIAANEELRARQTTIAEKLQIIHEIDVARYVWPHLLDEISRALPPYMWLVSVLETAGGDTFKPRVEIQGRMGNPFALTQFMRDLESSPFVRGVTLVNSQQVREDDRMIYAFTVTAQYEDPPTEAIQLVPVFADLEAY